MTDPPRGIVKPAIIGALTGLTLALAALGWLERRSRPAIHRCGNCPHSQPRTVP